MACVRGHPRLSKTPVPESHGCKSDNRMALHMSQNVFVHSDDINSNEVDCNVSQQKARCIVARLHVTPPQHKTGNTQPS